MSSPKSDTNSQEPGKDEYTVGWICALQEEYDAACRMLDERFDDPEGDFANDNNTYQFGRIKKHYVVIGCLPTGKYGTNSATAVAKDMVRSFPKIRFALMVGIGAGAPTAKHDIRLGDIVVGADNNVHGGIIQLDAVKRSRAEDGSVQTKLWRHLNDPPNVLLGALPKIRENYNDPEQKDKVGEHMKRMNLEYRPEFSRPSEDRLYRDDYHHPEGERDCSKCSLNKLEKRGERRLINRAVKVHYGTIGSSDSLMKVVEERIKYAEDPDLKILCFEMEAAGLMNTISCLVIRGICDYADSHKNDDWHNYAALAAAAYARELLVVLRAETVAKQPSWGTKVYEKGTRI